MQQTKRIKTMCAVHQQIFEVGDNDKVFIDIGNKTVTVCVPCQSKIRNMEVCEICGEPRNKKQLKTIRLIGSKKFRRICIWCLKQMRKKREEQETIEQEKLRIAEQEFEAECERNSPFTLGEY